MSVAAGIEVTLEVGQEKSLSVLPTGRTSTEDPQMYAVLRIAVGNTGGDPGADAPRAPGPALAEVLVVDTSRSMLHPDDKLHAAKDATVAAIRLLPDGTPFAVLSGRFNATVVYPGPGSTAMAVAGPAERRAAERVVRTLDADGGTAIGTWLYLARRLLTEQSAPIKHVLLLTDGRNEHDDDPRVAMRLDTALDACEGRFVCDVWGIGEGWDSGELLRIARRLHGQAGAVERESELPAVYERLVTGLLGKTVPELRIRLTPNPGTVIREVRQIVPTEQDPLAATAFGGRAEYVTRAWGEEVRHYQVVLAADPTGRATGEDLQLAAVELDVPDFGRPVRLPAPVPILVNWNDEPADPSEVYSAVHRSRLYQRTNAAVVAAYRAWQRTDALEADGEFARALALARELGDTDLLATLRRLEDEPGSGHLREGIRDVHWHRLILTTAITTPPDPVPPAAPDPAPRPSDGGRRENGPPVGADRLVQCPKCGWKGPPDSVYCGGVHNCGRLPVEPG
ncbi:VWA domain-containing protein [Streptomyces sp. NPDC006739]|uniref:VWA domain-containing protein n=1 Tax=Streptomyces sp. NPDC006739 TaxID=3364763 RepID=UPI0036CCF8EA